MLRSKYTLHLVQLVFLGGLIYIFNTSYLLAQEKAGSTQDQLTQFESEESGPPKTDKVSHTASTNFSYVAAANVRQGDRDLGRTSLQTTDFNYTASIPVAPAWKLRAGVDWERFSFSSPANTPLPDTLQSTSLIIGADVQLAEKWLLRLEVQPGIYSDFEDIDINDFQIPATIGFGYSPNRDLQWFFGARIGFSNDIPILPVAGVRWKFAEDWTLNLLIPRPRITYQINEQWQAFAGGELKGGTYRMGSDFGTQAGNPALNNAILSYMEIRAGAGISYQFHPAISVELDGGWVVSRTYDYYRADTKMKSDGAPYAQIGLKGRF